MKTTYSLNKKQFDFIFSFAMEIDYK